METCDVHLNSLQAVLSNSKRNIFVLQLHVAGRESLNDLFQIPGDSVFPSVCALGHAGYWAGIDDSHFGCWPHQADKSCCHHFLHTLVWVGASASEQQPAV